VPSPALSARWVARRKVHWTRLDALLSTCGRSGVSALTHDELRELALLYRQTAGDLSAARTDLSRAGLAVYLNQLLGRAHNLVYAGERVRRRGVLHFFVHTFPRVFRETWRYTAAATLLFLLGALVGVALAVADPAFERFMLGGEMLDTIERKQMWTHPIVALKPLASAGIMSNNLAVSFSAYATGILGGLGTAYFMLFNGLLIGVIATACGRADMSASLWSFVAPHGALELPAIFIAGGAGLVLGRGVLVADSRPRRETIGAAARVSIRLLLGVIPILIAAGIVEGFVSPTDLAPAVKFVLGAALFCVLAAYLYLPGLRTPNSQLPTSKADHVPSRSDTDRPVSSPAPRATAQD
jgi:uncharacterized membrane protein SpoIIM required for sporulation